MAVIKPVRGQGAYVSVGQESTWGTPVARTNRLRINAYRMRRVRSKEIVPDLGSLGDDSSNAQRFFVAEDRAEGGFDFNMAYDDSTLMVLKHLMGLVDTTDLGGGSYAHLFSLLTPQPEGLTIEGGPGTADFNAGQVFAGCLFSRGTITVTPGKTLVCSVDVMGKTSAGLVAVSGSPGYSSNGERILQNHAGAATLESDEAAYKQMVIRIDRALEPLREVGSLHPSRPVENRLSVEIELLCAWQQNHFHTAYFADTQSSFGMTFTSGSKSMQIDAQNCLVMDTSEPVSSMGMIEQRVLLKPMKGTGHEGLEITVTNGNALPTAN